LRPSFTCLSFYENRGCPEFKKNENMTQELGHAAHG
jgi:hypothetical protein